MNVLEGLAERRRHLLVQVLVVALVLAQSIGDELIRARLFDVVVEPRQIEFIHAEANKIKE